MGYQPTLGSDLAELEERISSSSSGAITSIQAVYVPADDLTDPAATHTFSHLSSSIVLSRKRAGEGFILLWTHLIKVHDAFPCNCGAASL